jgi:hypothetical protein
MIMTLYEKIISIYPSLLERDFLPVVGTIALHNDGSGDFIAKWEHPEFDKPTNEQLKGL